MQTTSLTGTYPPALLIQLRHSNISLLLRGNSGFIVRPGLFAQ